MADRSDDNRLWVLQSTRLLDSAPEAAFDRLARLAARLLAVPVALVSLLDEDRQFFKSAHGLKAPWATRRETPLSHSLCQYTARERVPLVVQDAREHPMLRDHLAIRDLDVVAYLGVPLLVAGEAIGALCVIDDKPRAWSSADVELLRDLAESVVSEIELRVALRTTQEQRALTDALLESLGDGVLAVDPARTFIVANDAARRMFDGAEAGKPLPPNWSQVHQSCRPTTGRSEGGFVATTRTI
jgi:GAF domain-containing protein